MSEPIGLLEPDISLDRSDPRPLFSQIVAALESQVTTGALRRGVRLPAVRDLASTLAVNRATVQRAYRELEGRGLVRSRVGSGTVVVAEPAIAPAPPDEQRPGPALSRGMRELARAIDSSSAPPVDGAIDFAMLLPDVSIFPSDRLAKAVNVALARGEQILQYGAPAGLEPLRQTLAERLSEQGVPAEADDVVIVNGVQQALDLLGKVLLDPGDVVVVESPTYANVLPLLKLYGARTVAVPLDAEGISLGGLSDTFAKYQPKLLYTMPSFQNPTGLTMSLERRRALLELCARYGVLAVEDTCEQELNYDEPLPPLAALEPNAGVAHLGTFSKGLFPGLRLGYVVARGELRDMLILAKRYSDYHADLLSQAIMVEVLASGDYDRHLKKLQKTYRGRMQRTVEALTRSLPEEVRFRAPSGGYKVWLELPDGVRASHIADRARRRGVMILAGAPFFAAEGSGNAGESGIRLSISRTAPDRIEEGIEILGELLYEAVTLNKQTARGDSRQREAPPLV